MTATLQFRLPEEREEFEVTRKALDLYFILYDLSEELRDRVEYGGREDLQEIRDLLYEKMAERGVSLDILS
jgi:hypothetical protein